jgi:hypothetical protein
VRVGAIFSWSKFLIKDLFDRCHYQSFIKNFVEVFFDKENFDSDKGPLCKKKSLH